MMENGVFDNLYAVHPSPVRIAGMASNIGYGGRLKGNGKFAVFLRRLNRILKKRQSIIYEHIVVRE